MYNNRDSLIDSIIIKNSFVIVFCKDFFLIITFRVFIGMLQLKKSDRIVQKKSDRI